MADKPRVKAPKQRSTPKVQDPARTRRLILFAVGGAIAVAAVLALAALSLGSGKPSAGEARSALEDAGCSFRAAPALAGDHSVADPGGSVKAWNTDPPTSGPHYGISAIFGIYEQPLEMARVVHNLEHGGIFILYGKGVPKATVDQLREFYGDHATGTVMAPLPRLGKRFALGAWVSDGEGGNGYLSKCTKFDEAAISKFFSAFQFQGPERYEPGQIEAGM